MATGESQTPTLYRMKTAPEPVLEPQVGWVFKQRYHDRTGWVKLHLVRFPDGSTPPSTFNVTLKLSDLVTHFEVA